MKVVTIRNNWLPNSGLRFDASFHLSDGIKTKRIIDQLCPYESTELVNLSSELFKGDIHKRVYVNSSERGFMFYTASDLFKSDLDSGKYISKKLSPYLKELELKKGWILISRSGTLGKVVYTNENHEGKIGTDDLVRIRPNESKIKFGYLYAFLASKFGYGLLTQSGYGGVVKHIEPHHVEHIKIPIFPEHKQDKIHMLITKSSDYRVKANTILESLVKELENLLNNYFGVITAQASTSRNIRELLTFEKRFDAPFNAGIGRSIYDKIVEVDHRILRDISKVYHPILFGKKQIKGSESRGNPLYKSSSMGKLKPETDFWLSLKKLSSYEKLRVKKGWVLISRTGTVGNVVKINKAMDSTFIDDHMIRVQPKFGYEGFIYCYLKCYYGQKLIDFQKYGSVQEVINSDYIERIPIPSFILQPTLIEKYDAQVKILSDYEDQAFLNEKQAIELVEKEIESWEK